MQTILIVIHLMIVVALVAVVLLQRSEGGGLGIGGGGGGFMSARGAANTLTRTTSILGAAFFLTSIALGVMARYSEDPTDVLDRIPSIGETVPGEGGLGTGGGILDQLGGPEPVAPAANGVPDDTGSAAPAAPAPAATAPAEGTAPAPAAPDAPVTPTPVVPQN